MDFHPIDADNHYYEAIDAFTRHLDPKFRTRGVRPVQDGKRIQLLVGGKINHFVPNPTFDPIIVPGCLDPLFRGQIPEGVDPASLMQTEPMHAEYRDRDERVDVVEAQGLDAALLFPTLGCGIEEALRDDIPATMASLSAFNRWLEDDWGFDYRDRLIAAPDALAGRSRGGGGRARLAARAGRPDRPHPAGSGARPQRHLALARQQAPRSGLGPPGRGDRPGGVPPRRQRLQPLRRGPVGRQRHLRLRHRRRPQPRAGRRSGHPRHHRLAGRARRVHPAPRRCGWPASRTARTGWPCS